MPQRICKQLFLLSILAVLVRPDGAWGQTSGADLIREGNQLFRDGIYRVALLRYEQAELLGYTSAQLDFNKGVTYYKVRRYDDAEAAFEKAAENSRLAPLAYYNIGLVKRAQRNYQGARRWFQLAHDRSPDRKLRKLAARAQADVEQRRVSKRSGRKPKKTRQTSVANRKEGLTITAVARVAADNNVYRTPSASYVDISQPGAPTIDPVVQSGNFVSVNAKVDYVFGNEAADTQFFATYLLDGDFYLDSLQSNADQLSHKISLGAESLLKAKEGRRRWLRSAFVVRDHTETNFDPDDGLDRDVNGVDVSDRFSYRSIGPEAEFEHRLGRWTWGFRMNAQNRDYADTEQVPEYDHDFLFTSGKFKYRLLPRLELGLRVDWYKRIFEERPARDANGVQSIANPLLEYRYQAAQTSLAYRASRAFLVRLDYRRTEREDLFIDYYNYTQNQYRLQLLAKPTSRLRAQLSVAQRNIDYPNAFAFNTPAGGPRETDDLEGRVVGEYRIMPRYWLWLEARVRSVDSTDPRYRYDRTQTMLGAKFSF